MEARNNTKAAYTLTDKQLAECLHSFGVEFGPIIGSTRAVYQRKLERLIATHGGNGDCTLPLGADGQSVSSSNIHSATPARSSSTSNKVVAANSKALDEDDETPEKLNVQSALASKSSHRKSKSKSKVTWSDQSLTDEMDLEESADFEDARHKVSKKKKKVVTWSDQSETSNDESGELEDISPRDARKAGEADSMHLSLNSTGLDADCEVSHVIEDCGPSEVSAVQPLQTSTAKTTDNYHLQKSLFGATNNLDRKPSTPQSRSSGNFVKEPLSRYLDDFEKAGVCSQTINSSSSKGLEFRNINDSIDLYQSSQSQDNNSWSKKPVRAPIESYHTYRITDTSSMKDYGNNNETKDFRNESNGSQSSFPSSQTVDSGNWIRKAEGKNLSNDKPQISQIIDHSSWSNKPLSRAAENFDERYQSSNFIEGHGATDNQCGRNNICDQSLSSQIKVHSGWSDKPVSNAAENFDERYHSARFTERSSSKDILCESSPELKKVVYEAKGPQLSSLAEKYFTSGKYDKPEQNKERSSEYSRSSTIRIQQGGNSMRYNEPLQNKERVSEYSRSSASPVPHCTNDIDGSRSYSSSYISSLTRPPLHPERTLSRGSEYRGNTEHAEDDSQSVHRRRKGQDENKIVEDETTLAASSTDPSAQLWKYIILLSVVLVILLIVVVLSGGQL